MFGFVAPRGHGHDAVKALQAMVAGDAKALICLGGNFAVAMPDHERAFPAMRGLDLSVHIGTKLNRSHLLVAKETFILPCLGRTELDMQGERTPVDYRGRLDVDGPRLIRQTETGL